MANYQATPQPAVDPGNTLGLVGLILAIIPCTSTIGLVLEHRPTSFRGGPASRTARLSPASSSASSGLDSASLPR